LGNRFESLPKLVGQKRAALHLIPRARGAAMVAEVIKAFATGAAITLVSAILIASAIVIVYA
jgi:hypothetical protein